jgi:NADPH:quinone reductase-like Zn-dependent oxidoreductase
MKVLQIIKFGELIDSLSINKIEKPSIRATDILIETKAAELNPSDYKMVNNILYKLFFRNTEKIFTTAFLASSKLSMASFKRFCSD